MANATIPPKIILPITQVVIDQLYSWAVQLVNVVNVNAGKLGKPDALSDVDAGNGTLYYSNDRSKLVYKDPLGVVNELY